MALRSIRPREVERTRLLDQLARADATRVRLRRELADAEAAYRAVEQVRAVIAQAKGEGQ